MHFHKIGMAQGLAVCIRSPAATAHCCCWREEKTLRKCVSARAGMKTLLDYKDGQNVAAGIKNRSHSFILTPGRRQR